MSRFFLTLLFIYLKYSLSFVRANELLNAVVTKKCDVPTETDPFDKSILPYIVTRTPDKCYNEFLYAELDLDNGVITPNYSLVKENSCKCGWNALKILLRTSDRHQYMLESFQPFDSPIDMKEFREKKNSDLILVSCRCGAKNQKTEKLFSYPNFKLDDRQAKAPIQLDETLDGEKVEKVEKVEKGVKKCPVAPNVIVMVIESLSYLNFKRHMKKTHDLFNQHFNSTLVEFNSVIKMGENSFQNMKTLITGIPYWVLRHASDIIPGNYYDNSPLIWKEFEKKRGYYTAFIEDMPTFGIFNFGGRGFRSKNTDYYNRNFFCALNAFSSSSDSMSSRCWPWSSQCYNGRYLLDTQFEQLESLMLRMEREKQNYFAYISPSYLTHGDFNMASVMDLHTSRFINRNTELLKNSVFLFLGDHGNRYGSQLRTYIGRLESAWPYLAINVPKSVQDKYPHLVPNMKQNSNRLVSWLDVHAALKDLVDCNLEPKSSAKAVNLETDFAFANEMSAQTFDKKTNYSLFTELIPIDRTCEQALIPSSFCFCLPRQKVSIESSEARIAGEEFVKQLNKKLAPYKRHCAKLELLKVLDISKLTKNTSFVTYDLVIQTLPSKGIFRGELSKLTADKWSEMSDLFERFDKYGKQGDCISNKILQKACYCNRKDKGV